MVFGDCTKIDGIRENRRKYHFYNHQAGVLPIVPKAIGEDIRDNQVYIVSGLQLARVAIWCTIIDLNIDF